MRHIACLELRGLNIEFVFVYFERSVHSYEVTEVYQSSPGPGCSKSD